MLRFVESVDAGHAKSYYTEGLAREDYYTQGHEIVGAWGGKGAERLGLVGTVEREAFSSLCDNLHPETGKSLTPRTRDNRRIGYDINFHAPKSVSVVYAINRDEALLTAFREAVSSTMRLMEEEMKTRVRVRGRTDDRLTGNMVWGEFVHFTARPVDGVPDPHLHAHCFTFNATYDEDERRWKAGQFGDLKADAPYFEAVFHADFAHRLRELGYPIERKSRGWEIGGLRAATLKKFSCRTTEIERLAREKGITDAKAKDKLGALTRKRKAKDLSRADLRRNWMERLTSDDAEALGAIGEERGSGIVPTAERTRDEAYQHALAHAFERESAVPERKLDELALRHGVGSVLKADVEAERKRLVSDKSLLARIIGGRRLCTSARVLREEQDMLRVAESGRNTCRQFVAKGSYRPSGKLTEEQASAVGRLLQSQDRFALLRGRAGVGKTTMMREVVDAIERTGKKVFAFAPSAAASRGMLRDEGFREADTVSKLLSDKKLQNTLQGQVLWIDEAGLVGTKSLCRVFHLAQEIDARVILTGDPAQHSSVERGDALRLLEERSGMKSPDVKEVQRQRGTYRDAVKALSDGRTIEGFAKLDYLGAIQELSHDQRLHRMAEDYTAALVAGKSVLAISPTHAEGERVSAILREKLRDANRLGPVDDERCIESLRSLGWTDAQRSDARNYDEGLVVQFHRHSKHFAIGERGIVESRGGDSILVRTAAGKSVPLPLTEADRFGVFESRALPVAEGEFLRVTQNGKSLCGKHRLHNGTVHQVQAHTKDGDMLLTNGWVVPSSFGHVAHGYVSTSHASQGRTVDRVLIAEGRESLSAANRQQFYVSVSRGRESVTIYTEDKAALQRAVEKSGQRLSATELVGESAPADFEKAATLVNRLRAHAQAWAVRQAESIASLVRPAARSARQVLLDRSAVFGVESRMPPGISAADVLRRVGVHPANGNTVQRAKEYYRDRER